MSDSRSMLDQRLTDIQALIRSAEEEETNLREAVKTLLNDTVCITRLHDHDIACRMIENIYKLNKSSRSLTIQKASTPRASYLTGKPVSRATFETMQGLLNRLQALEVQLTEPALRDSARGAALMTCPTRLVETFQAVGEWLQSHDRFDRATIISSDIQTGDEVGIPDTESLVGALDSRHPGGWLHSLTPDVG